MIVETLSCPWAWAHGHRPVGPRAGWRPSPDQLSAFAAQPDRQHIIQQHIKVLPCSLRSRGRSMEWPRRLKTQLDGRFMQHVVGVGDAFAASAA